MKHLGSRLIETSRLILHKTEEKDLRELWNILCLEEVNKYYLTTKINYNWEEEKEYQYKKLENSSNKDVYCWTIEIKDTKEIIGQINLFEKDNDIYDIGWFIEPSYQRMGYMYEASVEVIKYMFLDVGISLINTSSYIGNISSWKLMEKLGFKRLKTTHLQKYTNVIDLVKNYEYELNKKDFLKELFRKEELYITLDVDKEPYIKHISDDLVINITGESGSGKTYLCQKYLTDDNYIVIDTDLIVKEDISNKDCLELNQYLINKYGRIPDRILEFDLLYKEILECFKNRFKWIVIDSSQFRNIEDISILKGDIIILRTCINNCYRNCINRYNLCEATIDEKIEYSIRKKNIYKWYHKLNRFIDKIDRYERD